MRWLRGEAEVDDVTVSNHVLLAFEAHLAVVATRSHRSARDQHVVGDDFGANEAALNVGMNLARGRLCRRSPRNGPGAALVVADREERQVAEQGVACANDAVQP